MYFEKNHYTTIALQIFAICEYNMLEPYLYIQPSDFTQPPKTASQNQDVLRRQDRLEEAEAMLKNLVDQAHVSFGRLS